MCPQMAEAATPQKIAPEGYALGINAKSRATLAMERKTARFELQSVARSILPKSRTAKCMRIAFKASGVEVWKALEHHTTHYGGLQTCGSVWTCPVCAAKIAERRAAEIKHCMDMHRAEGGEVHLMTLTIPHGRRDELEDLHDKMQDAHERFSRDRKVKAVRAEMGYVGQIRALEVTHGRKATNNGWHPHFHILMFVTVKADAEMLADWRARLHERWEAYCLKAGLGAPSLEHGIDLQDGKHADRYVSKWGLEDEMTKSHLKKGKQGGETPFDLLRAVAEDGCKQAARLFAEFANCFKGRRQLFWTKGLKARYYLDEKTDEQLAEEAEERAVLLGLLTTEQWRAVRAVDGRATLLMIAARQDWQSVESYLYFARHCMEGGITRAELVEAGQMLMEVTHAV